MNDHSSRFEVITKNGLTATQEAQILQYIRGIVPDHIIVRFLRPPELFHTRNPKVVHHLDGNPENNEVSNLRVVGQNLQ